MKVNETMATNIYAKSGFRSQKLLYKTVAPYPFGHSSGLFDMTKGMKYFLSESIKLNMVWFGALRSIFCKTRTNYYASSITTRTGRCIDILQNTDITYASWHRFPNLQFGDVLWCGASADLSVNRFKLLRWSPIWNRLSNTLTVTVRVRYSIPEAYVPTSFRFFKLE